jgi:hypothetical protein
MIDKSLLPLKAAAARHRIPFPEYLDHIIAGELYCTNCRKFEAKIFFTNSDGVIKSNHCLAFRKNKPIVVITNKKEMLKLADALVSAIQYDLSDDIIENIMDRLQTEMEKVKTYYKTGDSG